MKNKSDLKRKIINLENKIDKDLQKLYLLQKEYSKLEKTGYGTVVYHRQRLINRS